MERNTRKRKMKENKKFPYKSKLKKFEQDRLCEPFKPKK